MKRLNTRTEQHLIRRNHPIWKIVDQNCYFSKNLYNYANYVVRQEFITNGRWTRYKELAKTLKLTYKCQERGVRFITTEESYTSGTSFLDGEQPEKSFYNKSRRIKRGLFQSENGLVNADVNGACQIIKKVSPNAFECYEVDVDCLQPTILNAA